MHPEKLARHLPTMRHCIDKFMSYLQPYAASGQALDMKKAFAVLTLAVTGEVAYGINLWPGANVGSEGGSGAKDEATELREACEAIFSCTEIENATIYVVLWLTLPSLAPLWKWLAKVLPDRGQRRSMTAMRRITQLTRELMGRIRQQGGRADTLGVVEGGGGAAANGQASCEANELVNGQGNGHANGQSNGPATSFLATMLEDQARPRSGRGTEPPALTDMQIISQALVLLLAGFETSSTTLTNTIFLLATHQDVQDKLRSELQSNPGCLDDMELLGKLPYLDAVVKESQRLYPAVTLTHREAPEHISTDCGVVIPRGVIVAVNTYSLHRNPKQWPQPDRFLPDRFLPETSGALGPADPNAFIPFGFGPRMWSGPPWRRSCCATGWSCTPARSCR